MDALTGVADIGELTALERRLDAAARTSPEEQHYGLILVDLLGLRTINSTYERATGDQILVSLAHRLRDLCPRGMTARVEADKFAVLIDGLNQDRATAEGYRLNNELRGMPWRMKGEDNPVQLRFTCVSGPSPFGGESNLLWEAQRINRAKSLWELKEKLKDLENVARLNDVRAQLGNLQAQMAISLSRHDPLTGALNRRGFRDLQSKLRAPYALAFVDVDNLKVLNGTEDENWDAGDHALCGVKERLESISPTGVVVRWGGDEFLLCLPEFTATQTFETLTSLLDDPVEQLRIGDEYVTFSGGVAMVNSSEERQEAMKQAQQCANDAKRAGRSRFIVAR